MSLSKALSSSTALPYRPLRLTATATEPIARVSHYALCSASCSSSVCESLSKVVPSGLNQQRCLLSSSYPNTSSTNRSHTTIRQFGTSSVSDVEVSKFSNFAQQWWDPRFNPLVGMNTIRMQYIVDQLMKEQPGKDQHHRHLPLHGLKALDVGCGGGILSESLARLGAQTTGLDPSTKLVEQARLHSSLDPRTRSIEYKGGLTVEEFANENTHGGNEKYDIVCLLEVLEHVTDIESILGACKQLLKPATGRLFVSTLNRTLKSHLVAIVGAEYLAGYLPVGTHNWNQFLSPREVHNLMTQCELSQLDVQGMVVTRPPPLPGIGGEWSWKLDPSDLDVNWIGTYKICEDADIDRNRSHTQ